METKLEQIAAKAVKQRPKSVVREIRTPRSVGTGGGRPPPVTRWRPVMGVPTAIMRCMGGLRRLSPASAASRRGSFFATAVGGHHRRRAKAKSRNRNLLNRARNRKFEFIPLHQRIRRNR